MNQADIDTFLTEQRAQHQAHLDEVATGHISDIVPPPTFEQWLAAMYLELKEASDTAQRILQFGLEREAL